MLKLLPDIYLVKNNVPNRACHGFYLRVFNLAKKITQMPLAKPFCQRRVEVQNWNAHQLPQQCE